MTILSEGNFVAIDAGLEIATPTQCQHPNSSPDAFISRNTDRGESKADMICRISLFPSVSVNQSNRKLKVGMNRDKTNAIAETQWRDCLPRRFSFEIPQMPSVGLARKMMGQ